MSMARTIEIPSLRSSARAEPSRGPAAPMIQAARHSERSETGRRAIQTRSSGPNAGRTSLVGAPARRDSRRLRHHHHNGNASSNTSRRGRAKLTAGLHCRAPARAHVPVRRDAGNGEAQFDVERRDFDAVRRGECHLIEREQELSQVAQRRVGPRAFDRRQAFLGTQRRMRLGDRIGQREAQALRGARRDRLRLPRREPAGVRHLGATRHTRAGREHPGPTPFPCDEEYEHTSREQRGGNHRNRARAIEAQRSNGGLRSRRFHTVGNDARDAERRATAGNRIDAAVGSETPQGGHLQRGGPRHPGDNRVPHDPLPG